MSRLPPPLPRWDRPVTRPVLVTGGTGYIGSHTCACLQAAGYQVLIVDDLSNSERAVVTAIAGISGCRPLFEEADVRDLARMEAIVDHYQPMATIHFAGVKSVAESARAPLKYYDVNVAGSVALLRALARSGPPCVVFSSSATVYGEPDSLPLREDHPLRPASAYGRSKMMVEQMLCDVCAADPLSRVIALRYFNPVGAHPGGTLGESPRGMPENLMPYLGRVACGASPHLSVFGNNYPTPDGTCIRDYVHVMDLAEAHVSALRLALRRPGYQVVNIGTGVGVSVLELIEAYAVACGHALPYQIVARRAGDVACYYADPHAAEDMLGWTAQRGLQQMCADAHRHAMGHATGTDATTTH
ncbi:MAG TPA: UDP-glucose 4-epimerase GalE [Stenotrophomonas sp.]|nr:UDP-glucose 4-epimerase GalE [Stenotrophomonas sp.]